MAHKPKKQIESHSSYLTNQRLTQLMMLIDMRGIQAADSPTYPRIKSYYNVLEQLYYSVTDVMDDETISEIEGADGKKGVRELYNRVMMEIETNPTARTKKGILLLNQYARKFNYLILSGLQKQGYLFRIGERERKGLGTIDFFEESIFGGSNDGMDSEAEEQT